MAQVRPHIGHKKLLEMFLINTRSSTPKFSDIERGEKSTSGVGEFFSPLLFHTRNGREFRKPMRIHLALYFDQSIRFPNALYLILSPFSFF
jgi:hypothetical protein